jgi:N-acetylneuraminic acid mutarotase
MTGALALSLAALAAAPGWQALPSATIARTEVAAARVGQAVYVIGGFAPPEGRSSPLVERFNLRTRRWRRVAPLPIAVNHAAAVAHRGHVYVLGGYADATGLSGEVPRLYRYDPRPDRWRRLPDAPTARAALAAGVIGDRLFAAGGARGGRALTTFESYDFRRRRWTRLPDLATAREHVGGAVAGGRLYVVGGRAAGQGNFTVVERYDPRRRRWASMPALTKARGGNGAAAVGGTVVAVGGEEDAGTIREVEALDTTRRGAALRWRRLADMRTPRHGLGVVAAGGRVLAIEGGPQPGLHYSDAIEALRVLGRDRRRP